MTRVMTERQWSGRAPGPRGGFQTRAEGQGKARRVWKCQACRCEYTTKPKTCDVPEWGCGGREFWYFASAKEARRASTLLGMLDRGEITELEMQPRYPLMTVEVATGRVVETGREYRADFRYRDAAGELVVEDVKPTSAAGDDKVFELKRAIVEASYGIQIRHVRRV